MEEQTIRTSEGCPYSCPFCFQKDSTFKDFKSIPEIKSNKVILHDEAFLSKDNVVNVIKELVLKTYEDTANKLLIHIQQYIIENSKENIGYYIVPKNVMDTAFKMGFKAQLQKQNKKRKSLAASPKAG